MIFPTFPLWIVDIAGSVLMVAFSFLCLRLVRKLKQYDLDNVIWTYLLWVCYGLAAFSVSRSAGHILKQLLLMSAHETLWLSIRPFSGAINTFMFVFVASVTLFFERIWKLYQQILKDKQKLQAMHKELLYLNQNLEQLVAKRTQALTLSEHKYRRIFEVSRDMILVAKKDGKVVDLNPAGHAMLGIDAADRSITGCLFQQFFSKEEDWNAIQQKINQRGFVLNFETDFKVRDGANIRALISGSFDKGLSQDEDTVLFLVKDIEERRSMEKQLAQADKLASIGQLSAGIAHEINNPLGIILGYTQLLLRKEPIESERHQDLKTIEKHVQSCKAIVKDLLNFAKSSKPRREKTIINKTIEDVLGFVQHHSNTDHIEILRDYDKKIPELMLDEKKIKQVLLNLIMNARHAVGHQGTIALSTELDADAGRVFIKVKDTGYGIEKQHHTSIFDPFYTTKPTGEGTGLGLSVSYGIIKSHGGDIFVESEPGKGSQFTVVLPVL
ncbi:MAG: ATP-binding protein [Desulfobacterales bacterium]|nr:ATP-binding protein [Desulfobacterales bacterium]